MRTVRGAFEGNGALTIKGLGALLPQIPYETLRKRVVRMVADGELVKCGGDRAKGYAYMPSPRNEGTITLPENFFRT